MCTELCGRPAGPDLPALLEAFQSTTKREFRFLEEEGGFEPGPLKIMSTEQERELTASEAAFPFRATLTYRAGPARVSVGFGEREYVVWVEAGPAGGEVAIQDWLQESSGVPDEAAWVTTPAAIVRHLADLAETGRGRRARDERVDHGLRVRDGGGRRAGHGRTALGSSATASCAVRTSLRLST